MGIVFVIGGGRRRCSEKKGYGGGGGGLEIPACVRATRPPRAIWDEKSSSSSSSMGKQSKSGKEIRKKVGSNADTGGVFLSVVVVLFFSPGTRLAVASRASEEGGGNDVKILGRYRVNG